MSVLILKCVSFSAFTAAEISGRRDVGNSVDPQPRLFEETVKHTPGVRAVSATALQREVNQKRIAIRTDRDVGRGGLHGGASRDDVVKLRQLAAQHQSFAADAGPAALNLKSARAGVIA
jgi:hypothetical protein